MTDVPKWLGHDDIKLTHAIASATTKSSSGPGETPGLLLGQTPPSSGRVLFDGRPGSGRLDVAGYAGQNPTRERLKAFQAATPSRGWPLASWFRTKPGEAARIEAAMRAAGVWSLRDRVVGTLSSGEKARLWLARRSRPALPR